MRLDWKGNIKKRWKKGFDLIVTRHNPNLIGIRERTVYLTYRHECVFHEYPDTHKEKWDCPWSGASTNILRPWKSFDIVLMTYQKDIEALAKYFGKQYMKRRNVLVYGWPHTTLAAPFIKNIPRSFCSRKHDFCVIGNTWEQLYPLRAKVNDWVTQGMFDRFGLRAGSLPHFGYTEAESVLQRRKRNITAYGLENQYENYSKFISNCKSVLVTDSIRGYDLRKYVEVAMAGAVLIGNVAGEYSMWQPFVIDIKDEISRNDIDGIARIIKKAIHSRTCEPDVISTEFRFATSFLTMQNSWNMLVEAYHMHQEGIHGFSVRKFLMYRSMGKQRTSP